MSSPPLADGARLVEVAIVGAGLAGLVCAQELGRMDVECVVFEASDGGGGRVRTDIIEGFLLDRGFQILLTAYPQVRKRIDVDALGLARFDPGAVVRTATGMYRVSDPLRRPMDLPRTLFSPVGSLADKLRAARLVLDVRTHSVRDPLHRPDTSTARRLAAAGFSTAFISALGERVPDPGSRAAACCSYAVASAPRRGAYLMLAGDGTGPALNVVVMSEVQRYYAPAGGALIARPCRGRRRVDLGDGLFVCGDHRDTALIQGAMDSGERTAAAVLHGTT